MERIRVGQHLHEGPGDVLETLVTREMDLQRLAGEIDGEDGVLVAKPVATVRGERHEGDRRHAERSHGEGRAFARAEILPKKTGESDAPAERYPRQRVALRSREQAEGE